MRWKSRSLKDTLQVVATFVAVVGALASLILQIRAWSQDAEQARYVSIAPYLIFLVIALYLAVQARAKNQQRLWGILAVLLFVSCGYAFLWGTWVEPRTPGCADYAIKITAPLTNASIPGGETEVKGTLRGSPPDGSVALIVRMPDGSHNWPQAAPLQIDPVLGVWRGRVTLGGDPPQEHRVAVAFLGRSGRILVDYFFKVGQETGKWPTIENLPDDVQICDQITVRKEP